MHFCSYLWWVYLFLCSYLTNKVRTVSVIEPDVDIVVTDDATFYEVLYIP